jgi:hypothetical protein
MEKFEFLKILEGIEKEIIALKCEVKGTMPILHPSHSLYEQVLKKVTELKIAGYEPKYMIVSKDLELKLIKETIKEAPFFNDPIKHLANTFSVDGSIFCGLTVFSAKIKKDFIIGF